MKTAAFGDTNMMGADDSCADPDCSQSQYVEALVAVVSWVPNEDGLDNDGNGLIDCGESSCLYHLLGNLTRRLCGSD